MVRKIRVGVLGATGIVGQRYVQMLENHPHFELVTLSASLESAGKKFGDIPSFFDFNESVKEMIIQESNPNNFEDSGVEIVFSSVPSDVARNIELELANKGIAVFSNAASYRMEKDVPILIPEVNYEHLEMIKIQKNKNGCEGFIVTNANCTTTGLVMGLKPFVDNFKIKKVIVSTYQALSGAGYRGIPSLAITTNVVPFIRGEEEKIERETRKILGQYDGAVISHSDIDVYSNCVRVPVRDGHLESVAIEFVDNIDADIEDIKYLLKNFISIPQERKLPTAPNRPIVVRDDEDRPQPLLDVYAGFPTRAKGMAITIGRIRKSENIVSMFLLLHNTIRGAAGGSILNAELALSEGYL